MRKSLFPFLGQTYQAPGLQRVVTVARQFVACIDLDGLGPYMFSQCSVEVVCDGG